MTWLTAMEYLCHKWLRICSTCRKQFPVLYQVRVITVFTVFRLLTDFVCLYNYEFWLSLCKIVRSSVILLLPIIPHSWLITGSITRLTRRVSLLEHLYLYLYQSTPVDNDPLLAYGQRGNCYPSEFALVLVRFMLLDLMFCRSLFVLLYFFLWSLCCLCCPIYGLW
jgi:hypothetical protein